MVNLSRAYLVSSLRKNGDNHGLNQNKANESGKAKARGFGCLAKISARQVIRQSIYFKRLISRNPGRHATCPSQFWKKWPQLNEEIVRH